MSVLSRPELESSPLADLHAIASELGIDGFRRLRKAALVDTILARQNGEERPSGDSGGEAAEAEGPAPRRRGRRAAEAEAEGPEAVAEEPESSDQEEEAPPRRRGRRSAAKAEAAEATEAETEPSDEEAPRRRGRRGGRGRARVRDRDTDRDEAPAAAEPSGDEAAGEDEVVEGVVELLGNGSGFLRVSPPDPSDDDVYISAAQVRRCELVSGDKVAGPKRPPRRSERYPSLVRIDTINGRSAEEVAEGTHFDDLPCAFPDQRFALGGEEPTLKAIEWLTPLGRGSRATIVGDTRSGKTEALRRLAVALSAQEELQVSVVLAGVRPEEAADWQAGGVEPLTTLTLGASAAAQGQAVERTLETARRIAARGADAVVLIDSLDGLHTQARRKALAAARNIVDGGSLTVIATAAEPVGGESTVVALDRALTSTGRFPALDLVSSGTLRPELLVGDAGAQAIAEARAAALG